MGKPLAGDGLERSAREVPDGDAFQLCQPALKGDETLRGVGKYRHGQCSRGARILHRHPVVQDYWDAVNGVKFGDGYPKQGFVAAGEIAVDVEVERNVAALMGVDRTVGRGNLHPADGVVLLV